MKLKTNVPGWLLASSAAVLLAACGGGGGNEVAQTESPAARSSKPVAQEVPAQSLVEEALTGRAARADEDVAALEARAAAQASRFYIVQLTDPPALAYDGGIAGLAEIGRASCRERVCSTV